jgi:hypothetical protein
MFTTKFWKEAGERAVKSAAQAVLGLAVLDGGFNALEFDWSLAGGFALGGAVLSILTSLVTSGIGQPNSPSAVTTEPNPEVPAGE